MGLQVKNKDDKDSPMKPFEQIRLPNGLTAEVYDRSRPIAADTNRVEILIRIGMALRPDDFAEPSQYEKTCAVFGPEIFFEHQMVQSFVINKEKEATFRTLLETFKRNALPYLSTPRFPTQLAQSRYREILKNPYKYRILQDNRTEPA